MSDLDLKVDHFIVTPWSIPSILNLIVCSMAFLNIKKRLNGVDVEQLSCVPNDFMIQTQTHITIQCLSLRRITSPLI